MEVRQYFKERVPENFSNIKENTENEESHQISTRKVKNKSISLHILNTKETKKMLKLTKKKRHLDWEPIPHKEDTMKQLNSIFRLIWILYLDKLLFERESKITTFPIYQSQTFIEIAAKDASWKGGGWSLGKDERDISDPGDW